MYKSDFVLFGAFRGMKNSTKWGGEDWKLLDKCVSIAQAMSLFKLVISVSIKPSYFFVLCRAVDFGYEVYRLRCPGLVHYYHTKAGMWDNKN